MRASQYQCPPSYWHNANNKKNFHNISTVSSLGTVSIPSELTVPVLWKVVLPVYCKLNFFGYGTMRLIPRGKVPNARYHIQKIVLTIKENTTGTVLSLYRTGSNYRIFVRYRYDTVRIFCKKIKLDFFLETTAATP